MRKYVVKRVMMAVMTLSVILLVLFFMLEWMPGSPFQDEKLSQAQIAMLNEKYGLDQPVVIRFLIYGKRMMTGDFGVSYTISKNTPVASLLATRLPISMRIGGQAVLLGTLAGILLGLAAALKHNTLLDTATTFLSVLGVSLPSYVFALVLSYVFGYHFKWFPLFYQQEAAVKSSVLPTVSLSMFTMATVARFTRTEMLEVLGSNYMLFAQSRGVSGWRLIVNHGLRNALIPVITVLAPLVVSLMTGSMVVEKIFSIPGIGSLLVTAIQSNDYNVVITLVFLYSAMYIGIMLMVDILYGIMDPRIRLTKEDEDEKRR